jgi:hypothetical protein
MTVGVVGLRLVGVDNESCVDAAVKKDVMLRIFFAGGSLLAIFYSAILPVFKESTKLNGKRVTLNITTTLTDVYFNGGAEYDEKLI